LYYNGVIDKPNIKTYVDMKDMIVS